MRLPYFIGISACLVVVVVADVAFDPPHTNFSIPFENHSHAQKWDLLDPAKDEEWNKAVCKGNKLMQAMQAGDSEAIKLYSPSPPTVQSHWKFPDAFRDWFWFVSDAAEVKPGIELLDEVWGLGDALRGIGVSAGPVEDRNLSGKNKVLYATHGWPWDEHDQEIDAKGQKYKVPGNTKIYRATDALMVYGINNEEGVMCTLIQLSPKFKVRYREDWEEDDLPELQKASDIAWGLWNYDEKLTDERRKSLRYFAVSAISNWGTKALIKRAIGNSPLNPWLTKEGGDK
ncbi:hypothetical protein BS50DRAFT_587500 [Corynespora cassiicola Philippines]|uniref:Uncharacterized protein n=1 Tax=Corynespora cassiicola Philippines TaxID=1448308 RepID=A0A2T2NS85_CORCC|nr:hypothetical protein BS50DRAFT_587500 [Corynespora cassiicola Philippines]